jgi:ribonuclease T1
LNSRVKNYHRDALTGLLRAAGKAAVALLLLGLIVLPDTGPVAADSPGIDTGGDTIRLADLPREARDTLALIRQGGPFLHSRDGAVFANREGRLPDGPRDTYREYTVKTPGQRGRGSRRIIAADRRQFWYTEDHYRSFRRILE